MMHFCYVLYVMCYVIHLHIHSTFSNLLPTNHLKKFLVTIIAENMLAIIPIAKVNANPLIMLVPSQNRITQVISEETFESRIDVHALLNPSSTAPAKLLPAFNSSFVLSKIKMFASTAMPIERINPAMPAKVRVTGINLKIASTTSV